MMPTETPLFGTGPVTMFATVASVFPAGTVTVVAGILTFGISVESDTIAPPAGAGFIEHHSGVRVIAALGVYRLRQNGKQVNIRRSDRCRHRDRASG